ncbi:MAG TPA: TonB-dependent receptor [Steroidobacteraceae bacterium]|nr:TonB-dependent receptor [Steroidobacteraceae bacterium]
MTFKSPELRAVRRALAISVLAASALAGVTAQAQQPPPQAQSDQAPIQEVVVTGTLIKRTDTETPSPVQVLSAEDIQQSGYTNIAQILNNISANGANTLSQSFSQAFAAGASGVSLRGLTVADTLVLIDGQRTVPYPLDDDNQRSFVDTSAIPYNAIDHIDVLKDSASALYGADAIGGVVNVVLKKTYVGTDALAEYGVSEHDDGNTLHAAFITGGGQLSSDGYNAYLAVDFHKADQILASNRSGLWTTTNWTPYGGVDTNPGASTAADPTVAFPSSTTGYLINPGAQNPTTGAYLNGLPGEAFLPGCNATAQANNLCEYHMPYTQIQPPTEQFNALSKITFKIGDNFEDSTQLSWFNSKAEQVAFNYTSTAYPTGLFNIVFTPADPTPRLVPSTPLVVTVPSTYPGNPYGAAAPLVYNFSELGEPTLTTNTNTYRFLTDLTGDIGGWDIDAAAGIMYSRMDYDLYGNIEWQQLQNALNDGFVLGQTPNAIGTFGPEEETNPTSTLDLINATASKDLFDLPGGPLSLGLGVHFHRKVIDETAPPLAAEGVESEAGGPIYVIGTETDYAGFMQLEALPVKGLEVDGSLRFDHYDVFGNATTPKFAVKWQPLEMLALRGTWGKGFRAPSAAEGVESGELFGGGVYQDPILCKNPTSSGGVTPYGTFPSQCAVGITGVQVANPDLKPVTSISYTGGFIFEPLRQFNVSVDYYHIKLENDIISAFEAGGFDDFSELVRGPQVAIPYCNIPTGCTSSQLVNALTPVGTALFALYPYLNAGQTVTSGVDIDLRTFVEFDNVGKFTFRGSWTHLIDYSYYADGQTFELAGTHGPSGISGDTGNPKDRAVFTLDWDRGPWDVTGTLNYTSSFSILDPSAGETSCFVAAASGFTSLYGERWTGDNAFIDSHCSVNSFVDVDLYTRYEFTKNFEVHLSVLNVFNKQPPLDLETYGGGAELAYDQSFEQIGAIGRYFTVGASYKF